MFLLWFDTQGAPETEPYEVRNLREQGYVEVSGVTRDHRNYEYVTYIKDGVNRVFRRILL